VIPPPIADHISLIFATSAAEVSQFLGVAVLKNAW